MCPPSRIWWRGRPPPRLRGPARRLTGALVFCRRRQSLTLLDPISWRLLQALAAGSPEAQGVDAGADLDIARGNAAILADPSRPLPDLPFRPRSAGTGAARTGRRPVPRRVESFVISPAVAKVAFHGPARDTARAARLLRQAADQEAPARPPTVELTVKSRGGDGWEVVLPEEQVVFCANLRQLAGAVVGAAFDAAYEALTYRFLCHAGAVRFRGVDWLLPAPSGAGKTTLAKALIDRGGVCWSDDVVAFDAAFRPLPTGVPLALKEGAWRAAGVDPAGLPVLERLDGRRFVLYRPPARGAAKERVPAGERPVPAALAAPRFAPGEALAVEPLALPDVVFALTRDGYRQRRIGCAQDTVDFIDHLAALPAFGIRYGACDSVVAWMEEQAEALCSR